VRIGSSTGLVTGIGNGTINISYTTFGGCRAVRSIVSSASCRTAGEGDEVDESLLPELTSSFKLMPNPNKGEFVLTGMFAAGIDESTTIEVVDMLGQIIYSTQTTAISGRVNEIIQLSSKHPNGMYLLSIRTSKETKVLHFVVSR
jgi:actin-like ATPase involved in cell morphogenesis